MFIKLTLICLAIVPLIIGAVSENPIPSATTRVGKFFGLFSGKNIKMTLLGFLNPVGDSHLLTRTFLWCLVYFRPGNFREIFTWKSKKVFPVSEEFPRSANGLVSL